MLQRKQKMEKSEREIYLGVLECNICEVSANGNCSFSAQSCSEMLELRLHDVSKITTDVQIYI